jgi:hypothetical protein
VTTPLTLGFHETLQWRLGEHIIAQSGDQCVPGSWVFVRQSQVCMNSQMQQNNHSLPILKDAIIIGRIFEILVPESLPSNIGVVTVDIFELGDALHPDFDMPVLRKTSNHHRYCTVSSKVRNVCHVLPSTS